MSGKFILIFIICLNIMTLVMSYGCVEMAQDDGAKACAIGGNNRVLGLFLSEQTINNSQTPNGLSGVGFSDNWNSAAEGFDKQQAGASSNPLNEGFSFLDGLKMALGVVTLITPIPIASFLFSLGLPFFITLILSLLPLILYILAIAEFVRGASF